MQGLLNLKKMGFEIVNLEDFDYKRFSKEGNKYLIERFGEEVGKAQIKHSDIPQERKIAKEFVKVFDFDMNNLCLHDPGLPPRKNRKVSIKRFIKAWAYPSTREKGLMAFRLNESLKVRVDTQLANN